MKHADDLNRLDTLPPKSPPDEAVIPTPPLDTSDMTARSQPRYHPLSRVAYFPRLSFAPKRAILPAMTTAAPHQTITTTGDSVPPQTLPASAALLPTAAGQAALEAPSADFPCTMRMEPLPSFAQALAKKATAPATLRAYKAGWTHFSQIASRRSERFRQRSRHSANRVKPGWRVRNGGGERMRCVGGGSAAVSERPDRTAEDYRRFRCRVCAALSSVHHRGLC